MQYYYQTAAGETNSNFPNLLFTTLGKLITGSSSTGSLVKDNAMNITGQLNGTPAFINAIQPNGSGGNTTLAYLTILFFDERFNFIDATDGGVAQQQVASSVGSAGLSLTLPNVRAPKNGYAFVYVSNRSNEDVYFDNLLVGITAGNIIEENHYYAYGLKITGISSRKLSDANEGDIKNNYLYNDKELFDDADLNWYDYGFRNYDPQIGRFVQLDPLTDSYPFYTPYQFAGDEPIANVDIDGLEPGKVVGGLSSAFNTTYLATESILFTPMVHAATKGVAKAATKGLLSTTASLLGKASRILNPILTRPAGNVSESTCPSCRVKALPEIPKQETNIHAPKPCPNCIHYEAEGGDPMVKIIRRETVEKLNSKPGDEILSLIGISNLVKAGRMEVHGFHEEAMDNLKNSPGEVALSIIPISRVAKGGSVLLNASEKYVILGKFPDYINFASKYRNATVLNLPNKWAHLSKQEAAKFLWKQNSSQLRRALRDGYIPFDIGYGGKFYQAEKLVLENKGLGLNGNIWIK